MTTQTVKTSTEAERWLVRTANPDAGSDVKAAFAQWRLKDPRHAEAYDRARALWVSTGEMLDNLRGDPELQALLADARQPAPKAWWRRPMPLAACAAAVAVATVAVVVLNVLIWPGVTPDVYTTGTGERRTVTLADGSQVLLDAATTLEVALADDRRHLFLRNGQARFTVAPNPNRPFVVDTANGSVTALGTVFDVLKEACPDAHKLDAHKKGCGASVTLIEGSIEVKSRSENQPEQRAVLQSGQRVALLPDGHLSEPEQVDLDLATEWTRGRLVFKNEPIADVVATLNRHTARQIVLSPSLDSDYTLHGTFDADDPDAVIETITLLFPIQAVEKQNAILLTRDRARQP